MVSSQGFLEHDGLEFVRIFVPDKEKGGTSKSILPCDVLGVSELRFNGQTYSILRQNWQMCSEMNLK